ncbi:alpha/beta fold hydrolase [Streptomyces nitrosporeus]|uniref:alpha/beta fold hydrolase n=1 Tax=Streptomyces nitrosporeus TaxID=28894 RepID=UPI0039A16C2B
MPAFTTLDGAVLAYRLLGRITAPTPVIGGTRSHVDQEQLRSPAGRTPGGRYAPVDAGHLVHADNPDGFLAALASFGIGRG